MRRHSPGMNHPPMVVVTCCDRLTAARPPAFPHVLTAVVAEVLASGTISCAAGAVTVSVLEVEEEGREPGGGWTGCTAR